MTSADNSPVDPVIQGDPFGGIKNEKGNDSPSPGTVNGFHNRSDLDSSTGAQHHTLGIGHNQAAAGDHIHDGLSTRLIGKGLGLAISGTKNTVGSEDSIVAMLKTVIDFTDGRV
jgi:hypothetical protein